MDAALKLYGEEVVTAVVGPPTIPMFSRRTRSVDPIRHFDNSMRHSDFNQTCMHE